MNIELLPASFTGVMEPLLKTFSELEAKDYWYEVKWDGVRLLSVITPSGVRVINRHGRDKTLQFPELLSLPAHLSCKSAVVDGEGVVVLQNRPDFPAVIKRNNRQSAPQPNLLVALPLTYMIFDILVLDGQCLLNESYEERKELLQSRLVKSDQLQLVEGMKEGADLWAAVQKLELEGIVAKKKGSRYLSGKKHQSWFKIKHRRHQWFLIIGYTLKNGKINALLVGERSEDGIKYCGRVALTGEPSRDSKFLAKLVALPPVPQLYDGIKENGIEAVNIQPVFAAEIEYAEWTPDLRLRHPVLKGVKPVREQG